MSSATRLPRERTPEEMVQIAASLTRVAECTELGHPGASYYIGSEGLYGVCTRCGSHFTPIGDLPDDVVPIDLTRTGDEPDDATDLDLPDLD